MDDVRQSVVYCVRGRAAIEDVVSYPVDVPFSTMLPVSEAGVMSAHRATFDSTEKLGISEKPEHHRVMSSLTSERVLGYTGT